MAATNDQATQSQTAAPAPAAAPQAPNPNVVATKQYAQGYWSFLTSSIKHPYVQEFQFNRYFGLTTLLLNAFLMGLIAYFLQKTAMARAEVYGLLSWLPVARGLGFSVFLGTFISAAALLFLTASIAYLVAHHFLGDKQLGYMDSLTQFAHFSNLSVFVGLVALLFSMLGGVGATFLTMMLIGAIATLFNIAYTATIFKAEKHTNLDRIYAYILGTIILSAVLFIASMILITIVGTSFI
ncbi:DUF6574 domain-containing protein [Lacticaseibacillus saniviri]|uniref:DUF6574 domain-containing protein n=2 Tax=Lacticaseibacillus saniviri TaxID=931533 RepID=UPI0006D1AE39|nr:DUF6574 domain-containing protein [Lacticaseibacillus saniviri]